tara:strand:- start:1232 stop:2107 length:876 start_codon:yes stop_codon:yes gene_type:complete
MAKILVTGSDGQLGQCFKEVANEFSKHKLLLVNKAAVDINNKKTLSSKYEKIPFDLIINCAGYTNVDKAENEVADAEEVNFLGVKSLVEFAEEKKIKIIHFSTDFVFDGKLSERSYNETDTPNPINIYGKTKLSGENAIKKAECLHTTFRIAWLFSPFGNNFIKTIIKASKSKNSVKIVNDQWGTPTYGLDLARALLSRIEHPDLFKYETYHYAQGPMTNWFRIASKVINLLGVNCNVSPISTSDYPSVAKRPLSTPLDTSRVEDTLALSIRDWESALEDCLTNLQKNEVI